MRAIDVIARALSHHAGRWFRPLLAAVTGLCAWAGTVDAQCPPEGCPPNSPPIVTIVTPNAGLSGTRTPVIRVTYQPGGSLGNDEINLWPGTTVMTWGGVDVTTLGRYNKRIWEWEVTPQYQIGFGLPGRKTLAVTVCSVAGLCTSLSRVVGPVSSIAPNISLLAMPLEALASRPGASLGGGWAISGPGFVTSVSTHSYVSWNTPRTAGLDYSSAQSYPRALVYADLEFPAGLPTSLTMKLWDGGVLVGQWTQANPSCSSAGQQRCRVALTASDASAAPITRKWLNLEAAATINGNVYSSVVAAEVVIVNRRYTPYGSGWWPSGVMRLVTDGGDAMVVGPDGSATVYRGHQDQYLSPPGDFSTLVKVGSAWELRFRGGGKLVFDSQGRHTQTWPTTGSPINTAISYVGTSDQVDRITDPAGRQFIFAYGNPGGRLSAISDLGGRQTTFGITSAGHLTSVNPPEPAGQNHDITFAWYDYGSGWVLPNYRENALGQRTTLNYTGALPWRVTLPTVLNELGSPVQPTATWDSPEFRGLAGTASLDTVHARFTDARGNWTLTTVNRWGQALRTWDAVGTIAVSTYSPVGLLLSTEGKQGDSTRVTFNYDATSRRVSSYRRGATGVLYRADSLEYGADDRVSRRIDTFGNWTVYAYAPDGAGYPYITSFGDTTINVYSSSGRLDSTHVAGAVGYTRFTYDPVWGNTATVRAPDGTIRQSNTYDGYGRLTDGRSRITVQATTATTQMQWRRRVPYYNGTTNQADSARIERTDNCAAPCDTPSWPSPGDETRTAVVGSRFSYLGLDSVRLVRIGGVMQEQERRVYDALGRLVRRSRPTSTGAMATDTFKYDIGGNLRYQVTRRGYTIETLYDSRNRSTQRIIPTVGTFDLTYAGPNDELTAITAQAGYADPVGGSNVNASWVYDNSGRLQTETVQGSRTTTYAYDAFNRVASYADPTGTHQVRFHATRGTPDTLITPAGDVVAYSIDGRGRLIGPVVGASVQVNRAQVWHDLGGLNELQNSVQGGAAYAAGNLVVKDVSEPYAYDSLSPRFTEIQGAGGPQHTLVDSLLYDGWQRVQQAEYLRDGASVLTEFFTYDARGNVSLGQTPWTFANPGNHLQSTPGCTSFTYDEAGNLTQKVCAGLTTTYTYDALGRLTMAAPPGGPTAYYTYDALGQRIAKLVGGQGITRFVWRGGHVVYETDNAGAIERSYTWGSSTDDLLVIRSHGTGWRYYAVQDRIRSVRALVRSDGAWQAGWRYQAYGALLQAEGSEPFPVRFRWAGAQYDAETGMYYLRNRYYDPSMGRFTQEDPIGYAGSGNLYAYGGDPTTGRDPDGLSMNYEYTGPAPRAQELGGCTGTWDGCGGGGGSDPWAGFEWAILTQFEQNYTGQVEFADAQGREAYLAAKRLAYEGGDASLVNMFAFVERGQDRITVITDFQRHDLASGLACNGCSGRIGKNHVLIQTLVGNAAARMFMDRPEISPGYQLMRILVHELGHLAPLPRGVAWGPVANMSVAEHGYKTERAGIYYENRFRQLYGCRQRPYDHSLSPGC